MSSRQARLLFVILALPLVRCGAPDGDVASAGDELKCLKCGPDGDPPPPPPPARKQCYSDKDHDGVGGAAVWVNGTNCPAPYVSGGGDCDDNNAAVTYGPPCYRDADGDGHFGTFAFNSCSCPAGYSATVDDCNDSDKSVFQPTWCEKAFDNDHDGYATDATLCVATCPQASNHGGDCNDGNAAVHPEQDETAANGVDDDCNGLTDETTFSYYKDSSQSTANSLRLWFKVHDADVINYARSNQPLWAIVDYVSLNNSQHNHTSAPLPVTIYTGSLVFGFVDLPGLDAGTVYRATLRFVRTADGGAPFSTRGFFNHEDLGLQANLSSTPFFQSTLSDSSDALAQARPKVVNKMLNDWNQSMIGLVKNGNAYCTVYDCNLDAGGLPLHHEWCSEFYNMMLSDEFVSLDPYPPGTDYDTTNIRGKFVSYGSFAPFTDVSQLSGAGAGDYLGEGVPTLKHTAMFVALDADGRPWCDSGNVNNRIGFGKMLDADITKVINGIGHLTPAMLK
jgi:hypothetical protein